MSLPSTEQWRPIPGFEGLYEVSDLGRVRSTRRRGAPGGLLSIKLGKRGYPALTLCRDNKQTTHEVHRLVALAFLGPRPDGAVVRHIDGDPLRPHADNLVYGTMSENLIDQIAHGTHPTARRTHCPNGHEYSGANVRYYAGRRYCKACYR